MRLTWTLFLIRHFAQRQQIVPNQAFLVAFALNIEQNAADDQHCLPECEKHGTDHGNPSGCSSSPRGICFRSAFFFICQLTQDLIKFRESVVQSDQLSICIHKTMFRFCLTYGFPVLFFHHISELQPDSVDRLHMHINKNLVREGRALLKLAFYGCDR